MRNRGYVKRGTMIDVQIGDEYFVSANIMPVAPVDEERVEFKCALSIHNTTAGLSVEIDETITLPSTYKTVNRDITARLNNLIDSGHFDECVENIKNMLKQLDYLVELQKSTMSNADK